MDYKIIDDSNLTYLVVEYKGEEVTLHPSTREHRVIKDGICTLEDDHWTLPENNDHKTEIHAIRCRCGKCCGKFESFMDKVKDTGAPVTITTEKKEDKINYIGKKNISDNVEKKLLDLKAKGLNIQGVINKDDPEAMKSGLIAIFESLKDNK